MRTTGTLIVGAGQAGLALSWHLTQAGHEHVVLERGRIGERWRSERWPSLTLLTPNWLNALPGADPHADPAGFLARGEFVGYLDAYGRSFDAPVVEGAAVRSVRRAREGFRVETDRGGWFARSVVVATGDCDVPCVPAVAATAPPGILQLHSSGYRSPADLPDGGVLVVGAGPSGQQLALELRRAGRAVTLAAGRHGRILRRYRGRDVFEWLSELGDLDRMADDVADLQTAKRTPSLPLTGGNGGEQLDLRVLHEAGVAVTGRLRGFAGTRAIFADDLPATVEDADERMRRLLAKIDEHVERTDVAVPAPEPVPDMALPAAPTSLDLGNAGVSTILWATGYGRAYPWLQIPVTDVDGELIQEHGVTPVPGLYTLGLRFQRRRKSHFIGGVGDDAEFLAAHIVEAARRPAAANTHRAARPSAPIRKEHTVNLATIKTVPLFASVPSKKHEQLASFADEIDVPAGAELVKQGGYALEFFVVLDGTADVVRDGERVATLQAGDFFGEVGLLKTAWLRTATVVATSPMRLLVVGRREFQTMMDALPAVAEPVLQAAAARY